MSDPRVSRAERFARMHRGEGCFVVPNAWDAGSAKMLVAEGFEAIATTSAGIAFGAGKPDNLFCSEEARVGRDEMMAAIRSITQAVSVPVNADLEAGFGDTPEDVAETIRAAIDAGAAGGNIEDYAGSESRPLYDRTLAVERIAAAREAIDASGIPFVLVARTDRLNIGRPDGLAEAIERLNLYRAAGADCSFAPGLADRESIATLVREVDGPVSVVMGLADATLTLAELAELGVRRVSIGGSLIRALYHHIRRAAQEMLRDGTFSFARTQIPQSELNRIFESKR
jgi:2-methylisocitrate lyase-like PEP mutase family enzyme